MVYKISENDTRSMTALRIVIEKLRAVSVKFLQHAAWAIPMVYWSKCIAARQQTTTIKYCNTCNTTTIDNCNIG